MKGLSGKEMEMVSFLELNEKFFFTREDVRRFFRNGNEMAVYLHKLRKKGRIVRLSKTKYYLIPVKAFEGHWSEHPFIIVDETMNGKDYYIGGSAAAHYWGFIEQIPSHIEVYTTRKSGTMEMFGFSVTFRRVRKLEGFVRRKIKGHAFLIASRNKARKSVKQTG